MRYFNWLIIILLLTGFVACENRKEELMTESVADYYPLQVGKYITYRVDSLVFLLNGTRSETHKYQVKHTIQSEVKDAAGRKSFLVNRLIRNEAGAGPWLENGNYVVTPLPERIEVVEHNLRSIRLANPLTRGFTWKGYSYYPLFPYKSIFEMDAGNDMNTWQFAYSNFGDTTVNGNQYQNVWTVTQNDFVLNIPPPNNQSLGLKEVGLEQYAKGIGLVYRNYEVYEFQPGHVDNAYQPTYTGFGVTMWMIDHN